jgi:hypothetical protein
MKIKIIRLFILISLFMPAVSSARADDPPRFTLADAGLKTDIQIKSIFDQVQVHFPLSAGRKIRSATLKLHLAHRAKLLPDRSDLVIALNHEPTASLILKPDNAGPLFIDVALPVAALQPGNNVLTFQVNMRLDETGCSDANDTALWTTILADSVIELDGSEVALQPDLSIYPAPFDSASSINGNVQISIVLPAQPTTGELTAAAQIAASLGQAAKWDNPPLHTFTIDQLPAERAENDHLIVIDTAHRNPLAASAAYGISEIISPRNPKRLMLIVSGPDDSELSDVSALLTTRSARNLLSGTHIDPRGVNALTLPVRSSRATFIDLGLTDQKFSGIGLHDVYYPIDVPYDWKLTSDASINLHFTHAHGLSASSSMKTYINGFRVADVQLNNRNDVDGRLTIQLSPRQVHPGRNWLHVAFDLRLPNQDCNFRYNDQAWAAIPADLSTVDLEHVSSEPPIDVHFLPSALIVPIDLSADVFVLPAQPSASDLAAMSIIAATLGTFSESDRLGPRAVLADRYEPSSDDHAIVIGQPTTNVFLSKYGTALPQPLDRSNNGSIQPAGGRELYADEVNNVAGYIQMLPAPWSARGLMIAFTGFTDDAVLTAAKDLPVLGHRLTSQGNVAVITSKGIRGVSIGGLAGVSLSLSTRGILSVILIGTVIVIGGVGVISARRRSIAAKKKFAEESDE